MSVQSPSRGVAVPAASSRLGAMFAKPSQEQIVLLITIALLIVFGLTLNGFATVSNLLNLLRSISILGVLGLGMGLIVISRGIDLSEVAIMAGSWAIALIYMQNGMPVFTAVLLALAVAVLIGVVNGVMVAFVEAPALFVTLAAGFVIYGLAFWIAPAWVVYAPKDAPGLMYLGAGRLFGIPVPILVFAACAIAMHLFLSRTSIGRFIYSQGDNPEAARLTGVALRPLIVLEHVLVAVLAWIAGLVWVGTTGSMQMAITQGTMIFDVVLVVVIGGISLIGGRGSVFSVVVGCILIGTLLNAFTIMDVNSEVQNIIKGVVLLAAIVLDNWLYPRDEETARQGD
ncbi:ABC transporter permease [Bradyrhizobium elkanii]|uniref:ABC transporter permease n=1 Tax=Bradyrhizobium elkanii TaxID=29448 RepID=UPI001FDA60E0|nr:ABC transporter permease [Bradyrhizobium elkanii]MBP2427792.1 ribose transport system permease protein [Bradyrhizobium elkanii]WLA94536.1 ABC transporter permease [Bradyrhizobium elkanii]